MKHLHISEPESAVCGQRLTGGGGDEGQVQYRDQQQNCPHHVRVFLSFHCPASVAHLGIRGTGCERKILLETV